MPAKGDQTRQSLDMLVDEVYSMIRTKYRFMDRRWWMISNEKWIQVGARDSLVAQIHAIGENTTAPEPFKTQIRFDCGKMYVVDRVVARLATKLHAWDGLPAPGPCCRAQS